MTFTSSEEHDCSFSAIQKNITDDGTTCKGTYFNLELSSVFQPIFSLNKNTPVGFEALIRAKTTGGRNISPKTLYEVSTYPNDVVYLDRLCRTSHAKNYSYANLENTWLFLNVSPQTVIQGPQLSPFIETMLSTCNIPPSSIVIEIVEDAVQDEEQLASYVEYYRKIGCLIALDDFGSGHSNFERIWRIKPDIVKLDRTLCIQATNSPRIHRLLINLVSLIQEAGCLTLMEGIETEQEAYTAFSCNIDMMQGYLFGKPGESLHIPDGNAKPLELCKCFRDAHKLQPVNNQLKGHLNLFKDAMQEYQNGTSLEQSSEKLLQGDGVQRIYLLDQDGNQCSTLLEKNDRYFSDENRFKPLLGDVGTNWYRRPYFQRAIRNPGKVQVSRPYLSISGVHMCITMSVAVYLEETLQVICCDLDLENPESELSQVLNATCPLERKI